MTVRPRLQTEVLRAYLTRLRDDPRPSAFVCGPRGVGKTRLCRELAASGLDWDCIEDRRLILRGPAAVAAHLGLDKPRERNANGIVVIDELHRYRDWVGFANGLHARRSSKLRLIVTGRCAPETKPRGAERGLSLRVHPWSVAECARVTPPSAPIQSPAPIGEEDWSALLEHGGFPEPFIRRDPSFTRRWRMARNDLIIGSDLRDTARVQDFAAAQLLALALGQRSSQPLIYSHLSRELQVAVDTVRRWVDLMVRLQYGFLVRPWFTGLPKALRKEPKWFLRDWSGVEHPEARARTFVACHLLKAVEGWTDLALGRFELRYVRDKLKREADFLIVRDRKPWFLVTVGGTGECLGYFQACTGARHAFHVALEDPFLGMDCFERTDPVVVPARTLLSQLL